MKIYSRTFWGKACFFAAILITFYTGWTVKANIEKETANILVRQDIMYAVLESSVYPICVINKIGHVVVWNIATEKLTGLSHEAAERIGFESVMVDADKCKEYKEDIQQAFKDPKSIGKLTLINCSIRNVYTEEVFPVHISVRVFEAGEPKNLFASIRMMRDSEVQTFGKPQESK